MITSRTTPPKISTADTISAAGAATDAAIRVSGVAYAYGSRQALVDLSLEIARGELF
jgi:hypothetical protein